MLNLLTLFDSLQRPDTAAGENARFSAQPIPGYERHRLGKDEQETPSLLISVIDPPENQRPIPIKLEHLTVQYDMDCRISHLDGSIEEGRFTIVRCTGLEKVLHDYFLRVVGAVVTSLGPTPSRLDVAHAMDKLVELFRAMTEKPRKSIQGLWAELFLIARVRETATMIAAWHVTPNDCYDFSTGDQRIEVKSTAGRVRQHHFTLEQLCPPSGTNALIASIFVEHTGAGTSVMELAERIRSRASDHPDLVLQVDRMIALTIGEHWRYALEERFDRELAEESLAFFEPHAIPMISPNLPLGVSAVHFKSDLTGRPTADIAHYRAMGDLFQAALRR